MFRWSDLGPRRAARDGVDRESPASEVKRRMRGKQRLSIGMRKENETQGSETWFLRAMKRNATWVTGLGREWVTNMQYDGQARGQSQQMQFNIVKTLWQRKWLFALIAGFIVILLLVIALLLEKRYTAEVQILVESREQVLSDIQDVLTNLGTTNEELNSQAEIIKSDSLTRKVMSQLGLYEDPEFNQLLQEPSFFSQAISTIKQLIVSMFSSSSGPLTEEQVRRAAELVFQDQLEVAIIKDTHIISIQFTSDDPQKTARITDKIANEYVNAQLDARYETARRATEWLGAKIKELQDRVAVSEQKVEEYRNAANLLEGREGRLITQQVTDVNTQLVQATAQRAEADVHLQQARQALQSGNLGTVAEALASPIVQQLLIQETDIERRVAELSESLGPRHPEMIAAKAQIQDLRNRINVEVNKILKRLENDAAVARAREVSLSSSAAKLEARVAESNRAAIPLNALERRAEADRVLLKSFMDRSEEIAAQADKDSQAPDVRIVGQASVPIQPSFPQMPLIGAIAIVLGGMIAALIVLVTDRAGSVFRSSEEVKAETGLMVLGLLPFVRKARNATQLADERFSLYGEAVRSVDIGLQSYAPHDPRQVIVITSSLPNEGKTTLALSLATARARSGQDVLLIEADYRKPTIHSLVGGPKRPGLIDVLNGRNSLSEAAHSTREPRLYVVPAGGVLMDPLSPKKLHFLREQLDAYAANYQTVVVDTSPIMVTAEALALASLADLMVLAIRWGKTRRDVVSHVLDRLSAHGIKSVVSVVTMVDSKKHAGLGYGDSSYYGRDVRKYYTGYAANASSDMSRA
jgi:succinoglycan biosynthesis transport protein ExoP